MDSSEAASRRMKCIASHLAASPEGSCNSFLANMVCSSHSGIQSSGRKDSRLLYARQASRIPSYLKGIEDCQASRIPSYLKEIEDCQGLNAGSAFKAFCRKDSRLLFARQSSHMQAYFMREQAETQQPHYGLDELDPFNKAPSELKQCMDKSCHVEEEPLFARPFFDRGNGGQSEELSSKELQTTHVQSNELHWLPRMDILESKIAYVVTVELPGVNADGIRVEVNNDKLLVSGSRSTVNNKQTEEAVYHQRELPRGLFKAQWPIPKNSNIDIISADFMDGFLRILVPKKAL